MSEILFLVKNATAFVVASILRGFCVEFTQASNNVCFFGFPNGGNLEIADGCCGMRSMVALTVVAIWRLCDRKNKGRALAVVACSPLLAFALNVVRILLVIAVAHFDHNFATGYFHDFLGNAIFCVGVWLVVTL